LLEKISPQRRKDAKVAKKNNSKNRFCRSG
jgi:hypothetical protein